MEHGYSKGIVNLKTEFSAPLVSEIYVAVLRDFVSLISKVSSLNRHINIVCQRTNEQKIHLTEWLFN